MRYESKYIYIYMDIYMCVFTYMKYHLTHYFVQLIYTDF
jgi:hypothetical protein